VRFDISQSASRATIIATATPHIRPFFSIVRAAVVIGGPFFSTVPALGSTTTIQPALDLDHDLISLCQDRTRRRMSRLFSSLRFPLERTLSFAFSTLWLVFPADKAELGHFVKLRREI
jgi:hypothetical protein